MVKPADPVLTFLQTNQILSFFSGLLKPIIVIGFLGFSWAPNRAHAAINLLAKPVSNAKVRFFEDPFEGNFHQSVDLFWTYSPGARDVAPDHLLVYFSPAIRYQVLEEPRIYNLTINGHPIENPEWVPGLGFKIPLRSPPYPGTKFNLSFQLTCQVKFESTPLILDNFIPRIPARRGAQWLIPPLSRVEFPFGTTHISPFPQASLLIPEGFTREAEQNRPPVLNGVSIAKTSQALSDMTWNDISVKYPRSWRKEAMQKLLSSFNDLWALFPTKPFNQIILLQGPFHSGWGLASAPDLRHMKKALLGTLIQSACPIISPEDLPVFSAIENYLLAPEITFPFLSLIKLDRNADNQLANNALSCFLQKKQTTWVQLKLKNWIKSSSGNLQTLEEIFDYKSPVLLQTKMDKRTEPIQITFEKQTKKGYQYRFNVQALLVNPLFLEDQFGHFILKPKRTRISETFPVPLKAWETGLSLWQRGTIEMPVQTRQKAKEQNQKRNLLWQNGQLFWSY